MFKRAVLVGGVEGFKGRKQDEKKYITIIIIIFDRKESGDKNGKNKTGNDIFGEKRFKIRFESILHRNNRGVR